MSRDEFDSAQLTAMKHLLVTEAKLLVNENTMFPTWHLQISHAAIKLAGMLPANPLVIASLFVNGIFDKDREDVHYCCRSLLHKTNPAIGIPLSYALSFDNDSDWRVYVAHSDLADLSSEGGPVAALCVARLCEIIRTDPDVEVVIAAADVIEDAVGNVYPLLERTSSETFGKGAIEQFKKGVIEHFFEQSLSRPEAAISSDRMCSESAESVKECFRQSTIALYGGNIAECCEACMTLLRSGWEVGLYLLAFQYWRLICPYMAAWRSPGSTDMPSVCTSDVAMVGELLSQSSSGVKEMIDGLQKVKSRRVTWGKGSPVECEEELIAQTRQIVLEVPELREAIRYLR